MKYRKKKKSLLLDFLIGIFCALFALCCVLIVRNLLQEASPESRPSKLSSLSKTETPKSTPFATAMPTPTKVPYPPKGWHCVKVPILMYHHVEPHKQATLKGYAGLTVDTEWFTRQMNEIVQKKYTPMQLKDLSNYFDGTYTLPQRPIIITFDDGYADFSEFALPILTTYGFKSEVFIPTGLIENTGYMSWSQIKDASQRGAAVSHHTWSHANIARSDDAFFQRELDTATRQLEDHGYGPVTVFAYPYGVHTVRNREELTKRGFTIAVTTAPGQLQCKEDRFALRRTRIGNAPLSNYGL